MAQFSRILAANHALFSRKLAKETERKRLLLAYLKKKGRFDFDCSGTHYEWRVYYREHPFEGIGDLEDLGPWARQDNYKIAQVEYKEVLARTVMSRREVKQNRGKTAILKLYENMMDRLRHDYLSGFHDAIWQLGTGSRSKFWDGLESIFIDDGVTYGTGVEYATNAGTYGGLSMTEGAFGNASTDPGFRFWSSRLVNAQFGGGSWANDCEELLRKAILETTFGNAEDDMVSFITCVRLAYRQLLNRFDASQRIIVARNAEETDVVKLGFKAVEFEGIPITWEHGIPASPANPVAKTLHAYGVNCNSMMLCVVPGEGQESGSLAEGNVYYDENQRGYKFLVECLGNLIVRQPRYNFKVADYI